jgi:hypothetical protein
MGSKQLEQLRAMGIAMGMEQDNKKRLAVMMGARNLLDGHVIEELLRELSVDRPPDAEPLAGLLNLLMELREKWHESIIRDSMLGTLTDRVRSGEITLRHAEGQARLAASTDGDYVVELLADRAVELASRDPREAVAPGRILAAAVDTEEPLDGHETSWVMANLAWVDVAGRALERCPDARMQRHAGVRGERVRRWAEVHDRQEVRSGACMLLAALAMRLYRSPPPQGYQELQEIDWRIRLILHADERLARDLLLPGTMEFLQNPLRPAPWRQAAEMAEAHLREALAVSPADSRRRSAAAVELARLLAATGGRRGEREAGRLGDQALSEAGGLSRLGILALQSRVGMAVDLAAVVAEMKEIDVGWAVSEHGLVDASWMAVEILDVFTQVQPATALDWARRWEPVVVRCGRDQLIERHWLLRLAAHVALLAMGTDGFSRGLDGLQPEEQLFISAWDMYGAGDYHRASNLFAMLNSGSSGLVADHSAAFQWIEVHARFWAILQLETREKLRLLPDSIVELLHLGFRWSPFTAVHMVILDELRGPNAKEIDSFVDCLERLVIPLERVHGDVGREFAHHVATYAVNLTASPSAEIDMDHLARLMQAGCGARYAAAMRARVRVDPSEDADVTALLERVAHWQRLRDSQAAGEEADEDVFFEIKLTSYATGTEQSDGVDPVAVLNNIQMRADSFLDNLLLAAVPNDIPPIVSLAELQSNLGERTALLLTLIGQMDPPTGPPLVFSLLVSQEMVVGGGVRQDYVSDDMNYFNAPDGGLWLSTVMGRTVAGARWMVQQYAKPDVLSLTAEEGFAADMQVGHFLASNVRAAMEILRKRGVDHLCIVPYGPLRVCPMHLLGAPGRMLADDWIVSYLPHAALLGRPRPSSLVRSGPVASVGISYPTLGLGVPTNAPVDTTGQARTIAELFGAEPVLNASATPAAVIRALQTSRRVHIAAHGEMNARAPAFQAVQLAPSEGDDGRLRAADLLALDLNGLELVTLSACESALVRFDHADNPRGLAPTLLLRGAQTVVGTLWPVKARVAATFFPALYGELSHHDTGMLDAYALAFQRTRRAHPELRDWGAFYFMGDWRRTPQEDVT